MEKLQDLYEQYGLHAIFNKHFIMDNSGAFVMLHVKNYQINLEKVETVCLTYCQLTVNFASNKQKIFSFKI